MQIIEGIIAAVAVVSLLFFVIYVVGQFRMPSGFRPDTLVFNRYGEQIALMPNPGYEETEDEHE